MRARHDGQGERGDQRLLLQQGRRFGALAARARDGHVPVQRARHHGRGHPEPASHVPRAERQHQRGGEEEGGARGGRVPGDAAGAGEGRVVGRPAAGRHPSRGP